jgi:hypothetical protein
MAHPSQTKYCKDNGHTWKGIEIHGSWFLEGYADEDYTEHKEIQYCLRIIMCKCCGAEKSRTLLDS